MTCSICLDKIDDDFFITSCHHMYHNKCIEKWLQKANTCPDCRKILTLYKKLACGCCYSRYDDINGLQITAAYRIIDLDEVTLNDRTLYSITVVPIDYDLPEV